MSEDGENPGHITPAECAAHRAGFNRELKGIRKDVKEIMTVLVGTPEEQYQDGVVATLKALKIRERRKWTVKDVVAILVTVISVIGSIIIVVIR